MPSLRPCELTTAPLTCHYFERGFRPFERDPRALGEGKGFFYRALRGHDKPFIVQLIELWTYARRTHHRVFVTACLRRVPVTRVALTIARKNHPFASRSLRYVRVAMICYGKKNGMFLSFFFIHYLSLFVSHSRRSHAGPQCGRKDWIYLWGVSRAKGGIRLFPWTREKKNFTCSPVVPALR